MTRDTGGYVGTFLKQVKDVLASCVEKYQDREQCRRSKSITMADAVRDRRGTGTEC